MTAPSCGKAAEPPGGRTVGNENHPVTRILETAVRNSSYRELNQRIFELRRVYLPEQGPWNCPMNRFILPALITGRRERRAGTRTDPGGFFRRKRD